MTANEFRRLALGLPDVAEAAHMGHPDFRVASKIFATLGYPQLGWGVVCLTPEQQELFVRTEPKTFVPVKGGWGRAGSTSVRLLSARRAAVREALITAWRNRVPQRPRCAWAGTPLSITYHDTEWGVPVHDDAVLFEFLTLEGAQAGLSWETILKKREAYRRAFSGFEPRRVARFSPARIERLLRNPAIVRNRLKVESTVGNARAFRTVQREFGSFDAYVWAAVGGAPRMNRWRALREVPAHTPASDALSRDLSRRGFKFVGATICYAFMQAVGMVNDHTINCYRHKQVGRMTRPAA